MMQRLFIPAIALLCLSGCTETPVEPQVGVLKYKVTGMHCDACANAIQAKLVQLEGVDEATVSFEESSAIVKTHSPSIGATVLATIKDMQFEAEPVNELPADAAETSAN